MFDFTQNPPTFEPNQFLVANENPSDGKIDGFLSDYLSFDISHVASKPTMPDFPGELAQRIFLSGDFYAEGYTTPASGKSSGFDVLTAFGTMPGTYKGVDPVVGLATYQLTQPGPGTLNVNPGNITSLEGTWFDTTQRITATDSTLMISFPGNKDTSSQELAIIGRNGTTITSMYFGTLNFNANGNATFFAFPIADLEPGSVAGQISGTLSNLVNTNGAGVSKSGAWWQNVGAGTYTVTSGTPSGVSSSARLVVYRA